MQEQVIHFGPNEELCGILTLPDGSTSALRQPVALILNAGIVHRVGPFRLHVNLARQLADRGFATFRIDLSGLGDSPVRSGDLGDANRAVLDAQDAMRALEQRGAERFVVIGLCSGAFNAHQVALADQRVCGSVFLDGIVFRTPGYYRRRWWARLTRPRFWRNAFKRRLFHEKGAMEQAGASLGEAEFFEIDRTQQEVASEIRTLLERKVQMLFIYTEGYDDISGAEQFKEMYGLEPSEQLQVEYMKKAEHTFRLVENRNEVVARIADWYQPMRWEFLSRGPAPS